MFGQPEAQSTSDTNWRVTDSGGKGVTLQRCKGRGEMDPVSSGKPRSTGERSLVQVKNKEVDEADDIITKLIGDVVEPRRRDSSRIIR